MDDYKILDIKIMYMRRSAIYIYIYIYQIHVVSCDAVVKRIFMCTRNYVNIISDIEYMEMLKKEKR
jgi:hypothetical protein